MNSRDPIYRNVIRLVALEIWLRPVEARIRRFESAHDEWRRLNGLEAIKR